ncbi:MAG: lipoate--protein ligase family protein [Planctomycetota bacterium]|nr:lipoate--protein ligase family protein [Planctomycetota bacterium]
MTPWRLILSKALPGADNMALDEALLLERKPGDPPILRFYQWEDDTLSLGRFQKAAEVFAATSGDFPAVRRISSGGAILHRHDEITYGLIAPYKDFGGRSPRLAYNDIHDILTRALDALGVRAQKRSESLGDESAPFCYDRLTDFDLTAGADFKKLIGSAQHRRGRAFLQHGSIPMTDDGQVERGTSIERLLGRTVSREDVIRAIIEAFKTEKGISFEESDANDREVNRAAELKQSRYGLEAWTLER